MSIRPSAIASGLCALALGQAALAGGPIDPGPAAEAIEILPASDWSGTYVGIAAAAVNGDNFWRRASDGLELAPSPWEGNLVSLTLGHDWQSNRLTYGALLSIGQGTFTASPANGLFINCVECQTIAEDLMTLRGKVGFTTGQMQFFATGGLARADVTATNLFGLIIVADTAMTGWTAGIGVERRISDKLSVALSYDHVDLGTLPLPIYLPTGETDVDFGLMQVGLNLRW
jgi:opacity protein-like surface antigen